MLRALSRAFAPAITPGLGILHQYEPRPFVPPKRYLRTVPPRPAPKISIVMPTFDCGRYIGRSLDSVLDQAYPDLQVIVQDGGMDDRTSEVVGRFGERIRYARGEDRGQSHALNLACARAEGEILATLNADDLMLPGSLAAVATFFESHPDVDVAYGHRVVIDADGCEIGRWILPSHDDDVIRWASFIPTETLYWRRRAWEAIGARFDEDLHFSMDWDLLLRFRNAGCQMARIPRFLGAFRVRPGQKLSTATTDAMTEAVAIRMREHGRIVPHAEALARIWPYLLRHLVLKHRYRAKLLRV